MAATAFQHVRTKGQPFERGRQYGDQAGDLIRRFANRCVDGARRARPDLSRDEVLRHTLAFEPYYQAYAPHLVEEVRGVAAGARISFAEALLCNVRGEIHGMIAHQTVRPAEPVGDGGCTAFAFGRDVTRHGDVIAGQNSDQGPDAIEVSLVLTVEPDDAPPLVIFTHAGEVGYHGMNGAGVAHFANAVPASGPWRPAMPHYLMKRVLLEQRSVDDCLAILRDARVCSPANYVLADRGGRVVDAEVALDQVELVEPRDDVVVHANHYEHPRLAHWNDTSGLANWNGAAPIARSACRADRMAVIAREQRGQIDVDSVKAALADHATSTTICAHDVSYMVTAAGLIAEVAHGRFHVSYGNPCAGHWTTYQLP
jgi:isopenicillin-N N-acyltransferase-like protein